MRNREPVAILCALVISATIGACGRAEREKSAAPSDKRSAGPPSSSSVTEGDARQFADALERAASSGDGDAIDALIDWRAVLETAVDGFAANPAQHDFIQRIEQSRERKAGLPFQIAKAVKGGGSYRLLRIHSRGNQTRALFRLLQPDGGGVNYQDYVLGPKADGQVRAVDVYAFSSGEMISRTYRRGYLPVAVRQSPDLLAKLSPADREYVEEFPKIEKLLDAAQAGRKRDVARIYETLSPLMKQEKSLMLIRLQFASGLGAKDYSAAIADFRAQHPGEPSIDLRSIDDHVTKKRYADALACVDRMDQALGGDPYLNVLRAGILVEEGKLDDAKHRLKESIQRDPLLKEAYLNLLDVALRARDDALALEMLRALSQKFGVEFDDVRKLPEYAGFVKSPQYKEWVKERGTGPKRKGR